VRPWRSLKVAFTWWFALTLVVLYGITAGSIWLYASADARRYAVLALKSETETLAAYYAGTGKLDLPELAEAERDPIPLWLRVIEGESILAQTPGTPALPLLSASPQDDEVVSAFMTVGHERYAVVRHTVGGRRPDAAVEAIGAMAPLSRLSHRLAGGLFLMGLVVIPLAALGGRLLAGQALRPVAGLVAAIRGLETGRLEERLALPEGSVEEVEVLVRAFNDLLDRLETTVESMRRFTADASHELRNPLSVLRTGLEVALRRERSAEEYRRLLGDNLEEIRRVQVVVERLLALARGVPGQDYRPVKAPVDLSRLLGDTATSFATFAEDRRVGLEVAVEAGVILAGDGALLRLLVFNLLDNAIKHSPAGEVVRLALAGDEDVARLEVIDAGPGMPEEVRERLFRRFTRAGTDGVGGLGLSVAHWVVELHGGEIRLHDTPRGTHFEVVLPRTPAG